MLVSERLASGQYEYPSESRRLQTRARRHIRLSYDDVHINKNALTCLECHGRLALHAER